MCSAHVYRLCTGSTCRLLKVQHRKWSWWGPSSPHLLLEAASLCHVTKDQVFNDNHINHSTVLTFLVGEFSAGSFSLVRRKLAISICIVLRLGM